MLKTLQELFLIFTSVLFTVDPLTAVPTFLAMTQRDPPYVRRLMAQRGAWTCTVTLTVFALGGSLIFRLFGITLGAFKIALGVPMLAGPGAISTVMVLAGAAKSPVTTAGVYAAIVLTALVCYATLAAATRLERRLGQTGMRIVTRLMGLVMCALAAQFIVDGIKMTGLAGGR